MPGGMIGGNWDKKKEYEEAVRRAYTKDDEDPTHEHPACGTKQRVDSIRSHEPYWCPECETVVTFIRLDYDE